MANSSLVNEAQCTEVSGTGLEILAARPLMQNQYSKEDGGGGVVREVGRQEWVAVMAVREEGYWVLMLSLICSLCKSRQSQEMPGPSLQLIATAITKEGFL